MKIILNKDVPNLGEEGDVKEVANGYARNYLLPRELAVPYNVKTVAALEKRRAEIEKHKEEKRFASSGLKERIEAEEMELTMPAGANGKLFGAVTSQTVVDELLKKNLIIDRKKIDVPDRSIKSVGNYKIVIHLYEKEEAILRLAVHGQVAVRKEEHVAEKKPRARRRDYSEGGSSEIPPIPAHLTEDFSE